MNNTHQKLLLLLILLTALAALYFPFYTVTEVVFNFSRANEELRHYAEGAYLTIDSVYAHKLAAHMEQTKFFVNIQFGILLLFIALSFVILRGYLGTSSLTHEVTLRQIGLWLIVGLLIITASYFFYSDTTSALELLNLAQTFVADATTLNDSKKINLILSTFAQLYKAFNSFESFAFWLSLAGFFVAILLAALAIRFLQAKSKTSESLLNHSE